MSGIERVTRQLLDLLFALLDAYTRNEQLHGYELKQRARLTGPSTYRGLDRLEDAGLIEAHWEELAEGDHRPRRRYYRLNADGAATARQLLSERRPEALQSLGRTPTGWSPAPRPGLGTRFARIMRIAEEAR